MRQTHFATAAIMLSMASVSACQTMPAALAPSDEAAILAMLERQDVAWSAGDVEGFMDGYWQSPELRFASGGTVMRGYEATLQRYRTTYSTPELMGTLDTSEVEIVPMSRDSAAVHGRWELTRAGETLGGLYTLVMRRIDGEWKIISDTTTSAD